MSHTFDCGDSTALVGYLYGECDPGERAAIDGHVAACAACAAELAALQSTRAQLASWTPPEAELGFQIVRAQAADPGLRPADAEARAAGIGAVGVRGTGPGPWYNQPLPAWAQAAAAVVIFAAGVAMGIARGTLPAADPQASGSTRAAQATFAAAGRPAAASAELTALEERLRAEMADLRAAQVPPAAPALSEADLLSRVRTLIEESEQRQQRELALRTAQIVRDFDSQRRVDLAQIQRTFGHIEGLTGAEVREQRQMLNYLIRASQR